MTWRSSCLPGEEWQDIHTYMYMYLKIQPAQLGCLGGSAGKASAQYAGCRGFESRLRQLIFSLEKESCLQV